jgi:hypothetical protein
VVAGRMIGRGEAIFLLLHFSTTTINYSKKYALNSCIISLRKRDRRQILVTQDSLLAN